MKHDDHRQFAGISLRLQPDEEARLERLAESLGISRAKVARKALAYGLVQVEEEARRG